MPQLWPCNRIRALRTPSAASQPQAPPDPARSKILSSCRPAFLALAAPSANQRIHVRRAQPRRPRSALRFAPAALILAHAARRAAHRARFVVPAALLSVRQPTTFAAAPAVSASVRHNHCHRPPPFFVGFFTAFLAAVFFAALAGLGAFGFAAASNLRSIAAASTPATFANSRRPARPRSFAHIA